MPGLPLQNPSTRTTAVALALICATAFALRLAYRVHMGAPDFWENGYSFYYEIAQNIASGRGLWDDWGWARRPPVYPYFLSLSVFAGGNYLWIVAPQALFGAATALFAFLIGKHLFGTLTGLLAAAATAIYPYYVVHDTALQETGVLTLFTAMSVYLLLRARAGGSWPLWIAAGLVLGLTVLVRTTMAPFAILAVGWLTICGAGPVSRNLVRGACVGLALATVVGAWMERNDLMTGRPMLSSEAGTAFWIAHNPYTFSHYPGGSIDDSRDAAVAARSETEIAEIEAVASDELRRNDLFMAKGMAYVREHPIETLIGSVRKVAAGFSWVFNPNREPIVMAAHLLSYGPISVLGLIGLIRTRDRWREMGVFYALFIAFIVVSAIFWAHSNHRTHLDVYLMIFAGSVIASWVQRGRGALNPGRE